MRDQPPLASRKSACWLYSGVNLSSFRISPISSSLMAHDERFDLPKQFGDLGASLAFSIDIDTMECYKRIACRDCLLGF